jgi:hypothetical protein
MRGRLIQRFLAKFARLDTETTSDNDGYDDDFREVVSVGGGSGTAALARKEHTAVLVPCQIGSSTWEALRMREQGNDPRSDVTIYCHFADLERLGLVNATTKEPLIHTGDRLVSIHDFVDESLVHTVRTPPGLYVTTASAAGWGLNMSRPTRNLLRVMLAPRGAVA